jgi:hypothetical protein
MKSPPMDRRRALPEAQQVQRGFFSLVRDAFVASPQISLERMGVGIKGKTPHGDWLQVACPCCPDNSGSASISVLSGFLRCHQCGAKGDLFTWWGLKHGFSEEKPFDACKSLADVLGVALPTRLKQKRMRMWPKEMTPELMAEATQALLFDDDAQPLRRFLVQRELWEPMWIERLHLGAINGEIVFPQFHPDGRLRQRYRRYNPTASDNQRWRWSPSITGSGGTVGFWPYLGQIRPDDMVFLCEGEWDAYAALKLLQLEDKNCHVVTWTGGAGAPIPAHAIPESWRGREVHIVYDNDTFQGPGDDSVAPDEKKRIEMLRRRKNLVDGVASSFAANRCDVHLLAVPIHPLEKWGADLRDWIMAGHRDIDLIPGYQLEKARRTAPRARQIPFIDVFTSLHTEIRTRCQVGAVTSEVVLIPTLSQVDCDMGTKPACANCKAPTVAPNGVLDWRGREEQLACAMCRKDPEAWIIENVLGKPRSCSPCRVKTLQGSPGSAWVAQAKEGEDEQRMIDVISKDAPPLSGELEMQGYVYPDMKTVMVWCDSITPLDKQLVDLEPLRVELLSMVPHATNDVRDIDAYLETRHLDISNHITHVYGRKPIHIALELTAHSVLWQRYENTRRRGWLDCAIIGATRSGKSVAARNYIGAIGLGQHFTMMGNFSRAGFTIGAASIGGAQKMKPGALPRNHGKMFILDEAHLMLSDQNQKEPIFPMLQAARDIGRVEGTKIYGSQSLPAAVRLVAICNWLNGGKRAFAYPCEHLLHLYGSPESLSRTDFGVPIDELDEAVGPTEVEHLWTQDLIRAMVIRAWNMDEDSIVVQPDALALARQLTDEEWKARYSEEIPLYTQKEKVLSVLRIAIAIANLTLSHVGVELLTCEVRKVHVEWAARWLEWTWDQLGYARFSASNLAAQAVQDVFGCEYMLGAQLGLEDPAHARNVLSKMFGIVGKEEMRSLTGMDFPTFEKWLMGLMRRGIFEVNRQGRSGYFMSLRLTNGGFKVMKAMLTLAEDYYEEWLTRMKILRAWFLAYATNHTSAGDPPAPKNMVPLDTPLHLLIHEWERSIADRPEGDGRAEEAAG